ncbi:MAG: STAS domain-containing protein [Lachnospiraceae bacterium]|nr:STAS domain-containing protein [Lachnospiraceae bacterium]
MFDVEKEKSGSEVMITLKGVLDTPAAPMLTEALEDAIEGTTKLTFDFAGLEYLTSAGLRVLLEAQQNMDDNGSEMILKNVSEDIMEVFELTGFDDVLTIE